MLALLACNDQDPPPPPVPAPTPVRAPAPEPVAGAPYFDPRTLRAGDTIAGLRVGSVSLQPNLYGGFAGSVSFAGAIELAGEYRPHFDYPEEKACAFP